MAEFLICRLHEARLVLLANSPVARVPDVADRATDPSNAIDPINTRSRQKVTRNRTSPNIRSTNDDYLPIWGFQLNISIAIATHPTVMNESRPHFPMYPLHIIPHVVHPPKHAPSLPIVRTLLLALDPGVVRHLVPRAILFRVEAWVQGD